jgi:putative copper export protein
VDESLAWVAKAAVYGLGQLVVGLATLRRLGGGRRVAASHASDLDRFCATLARLVTLLLVCALGLRLWVQTMAAFGYADALAFENLRVIAIESRWGQNWQLQMLAALVLVLSAWTCATRPFAWRIFEASAIGLALVMPLLGHAAGSGWRHGLHVSHNLASALWLGTLGVMTIAVWYTNGRSFVAPILQRFSPIALTCGYVVLTSGLVATVLYVGSWAALWNTTYGRVLTTKLAAVGIVTLCGGINWRAVRRGETASPSVMTLEYLAALCVLALTGVLTESEHP